MSLSNHESSVRIPCLAEDGSNWVLYKEQLRSAVMTKKLARYLDGCNKEPTAPTAPGVDSDADKSYADAYNTWAAGHEAIKTLLYQTLLETLKLRIILEKKASGAWKIVIAEYDNHGDFVQAELLRRMHTLCCTEEKDPRLILDRLQKLKTEFMTAGSVFTFAIATDFSKVERAKLPKLTQILNSGASRHFDLVCSNFVTFRDTEHKPITSANGRIFYATGEGDV
ncbi:uncharacterized protein LAESUDRAFT_641303, partial [Laetiporus sulphureus 93-53]